MNQGFAVWPLQDGLPVWGDSEQSTLLGQVGRTVRLKVISRHKQHYLVRLPQGTTGYVDADGVAAAPTSAISPMLRSNEPLTRGHAALRSEEELARRRAPLLTRCGGYVIDVIVACVVGAAILATLGLDVASVTRTESTAQIQANTWMMGLVYQLHYWIGNAFGGTLGKVLLGIKLIDDKTGLAPGLKKSAVRTVVSWFSGGVSLLGYLWALWNDDRTWHDQVSGTTVVRAGE